MHLREVLDIPGRAELEELLLQTGKVVERMDTVGGKEGEHLEPRLMDKERMR